MFVAKVKIKKEHVGNRYGDMYSKPYIYITPNGVKEIWFEIKHQFQYNNELISETFHVRLEDIEYLENIKVADCCGTWYSIDARIYNDKIYFLCENEQVGDEMCHIIIDTECNLILDSVYNGFDDFDDYIILKGGDI